MMMRRRRKMVIVIIMMITVPAWRVSEVKEKEMVRERGALFTRGCRVG